MGVEVSGNSGSIVAIFDAHWGDFSQRKTIMTCSELPLQSIGVLF